MCDPKEVAHASRDFVFEENLIGVGDKRMRIFDKLELAVDWTCKGMLKIGMMDKLFEERKEGFSGHVFLCGVAVV